MTSIESQHRPIRSFVRRQSRMTEAQQRALTENWPYYGLSSTPEQPYNWQAAFGRQAPIVLEIGFGMGDTLIGLAKAHPEVNFVGIEVHKPGIGHCLDLAHKALLPNLKIFCEDALTILAKAVEDQSLDKVMLLFPDPWPKRKHHKRRIVQPAFLDLVTAKLKMGGIFHLATDWQPYAEHMLTVLEDFSALQNLYGKNQFAPHKGERLLTKFERRGQRLGHSIYDLMYQRIN